MTSKICRRDGENRLHQRYKKVQTNDIHKIAVNIGISVLMRLSSVVSSLSLSPTK